MYTCTKCNSQFEKVLGRCPVCKREFPHPIAEVIPEAIQSTTPEVEAVFDPVPEPKVDKKSKKK
jgi:predicted ATP-dependent serine protease